MPDPIIEVRDYSFSFGRTQVLRNVSVSIDAGEMISVIGPNGAGKSTLLKCLDRILTGGTGTMRVSGRDLNAFTQRELARLMSYVPQADGRQFPFTVREFVTMGRYPHLSPFSSVREEDRLAVDEAMALTGVADFAEREVMTLSGGERQKVYIAAALAQGARILLLDEPTTFLDPHHQDDILRTLLRVNRESRATIVSVTHDINVAAFFSDRVLALRGGQVAFCGPAAELMDNAVLERIYAKRFLFARHPVSGKPVVVPEEVR